MVELFTQENSLELEIEGAVKTESVSMSQFENGIKKSLKRLLVAPSDDTVERLLAYSRSLRKMD